MQVASGPAAITVNGMDFTNFRSYLPVFAIWATGLTTITLAHLLGS